MFSAKVQPNCNSTNRTKFDMNRELKDNGGVHPSNPPLKLCPDPTRKYHPKISGCPCFAHDRFLESKQLDQKDQSLARREGRSIPDCDTLSMSFPSRMSSSF